MPTSCPRQPSKSSASKKATGPAASTRLSFVSSALPHDCGQSYAPVLTPIDGATIVEGKITLPNRSGIGVIKRD